MNFFQAQDNARRSTTRLLILFAIAVISLILITNLLVVGMMGFYSSLFGNDYVTGQYIARVEQGQSVAMENVYSDAFMRVFDWGIFWRISALVSLVIFLGSLYKIRSLAAGGKVIAEMLGGRRICRDTRDVDERKILNVVEEMAIASGTPVPVVYLLPQETGINAFAAGNTTGDAIIGVTSGCISQLSRNQLQGVIAHEFSHILNGDMRLNSRMMGVLHGILLIGMVGYFLLRSTTNSHRRDGAGVMMGLGLGLGLMVVGFAGSFFGSMIKATISRQREYLADASAVQFTRNPNGIAGALKVIGAKNSDSIIANPTAPSLSHSFFATGVSSFFTDLFATHPPLAKRILNIDPSWDGKFSTLHEETKSLAEESSTKESSGGSASSHHPLTQTIIAAAALEAINEIGQPSSKHLAYAHDILLNVPDKLIAATREPFSARALIYALVMSENKSIVQIQLEHLRSHADKGVYTVTQELRSEIKPLKAEYRLPLIDIATAALRELSPQQYQRFQGNFQVLIKADNKMSLFEWALQRILFHHLDADFNKHSIVARSAKFSRIAPVLNECVVVLSLLAHAENKDHQSAEGAFNKALEVLGHKEVYILTKDKLSLKALNVAIDKIDLLKPLIKPRFLKACAACIMSDAKVSPTEAQLLRAFSAAINCPMPLLRLSSAS
ncbi:MAG: M48 family metallopeptidase [Thiohalomonadales bacterium]